MKKLALTFLILVTAAWAIVTVGRLAPRRPSTADAPAPGQAGAAASAEADLTMISQRPSIDQVHHNLERYRQWAGQSPVALPSQGARKE